MGSQIEVLNSQFITAQRSVAAVSGVHSLAVSHTLTRLSLKTPSVIVTVWPRRPVLPPLPHLPTVEPLTKRAPALRLISYQSPTGPRVAGVRDGAYVDLNQADPNVPSCIKTLLGQGAEGLQRAAAAVAKGKPF